MYKEHINKGVGDLLTQRGFIYKYIEMQSKYNILYISYHEGIIEVLEPCQVLSAPCGRPW